MLTLIIGIFAILTGTFRLLPQIVKGYKTRKVRDVSLGWEILGAFSSFFWGWYGYLIGDMVLVIGTVILFVEYILLIIQKKIYSVS